MRASVGLGALLLLAGCAGSGGDEVAAACVGPQLGLAPAAAAVGDDLTVTVEWLREGCDDTGGADEERPVSDVPVVLVQGGTRVQLGTVSGRGDRYAGSLTASVPGEARPGPATVVLEHGGSPAVDLTVLP